jgi:hypothetical protein
LPVNYTGPETSSPAQVPNAAFWLQTAGSQTESAAYNLSSGHAEELCLSQGSVTTEYQLPAWENNFKAQQLTLYLHSAEATVGGSFNPILPQQVELFDWQTGHWEELDGLLNSADPANSSIINFQANNILDPARFIEPGTGRLYLRFTVNTPDLRLIVHSDLAVKGTTG